MTRKKSRQVSKRERRRVRVQQIIFVAVAVVIIASFVLSLIT